MRGTLWIYVVGSWGGHVSGQRGRPGGKNEEMAKDYSCGRADVHVLYVVHGIQVQLVQLSRQAVGEVMQHFAGERQHNTRNNLSAMRGGKLRRFVVWLDSAGDGDKGLGNESKRNVDDPRTFVVLCRGWYFITFCYRGRSGSPTFCWLSTGH